MSRTLKEWKFDVLSRFAAASFSRCVDGTWEAYAKRRPNEPATLVGTCLPRFVEWVASSDRPYPPRWPGR
jgi:hypothetical protein